MPFCDACARHWAPPAMNADGSCPTCGEVLAVPRIAEHTKDQRVAEPVPKAPWHFKLLLGSLCVYLGWRAIQGVDWVADKL